VRARSGSRRSAGTVRALTTVRQLASFKVSSTPLIVLGHPTKLRSYCARFRLASLSHANPRQLGQVFVGPHSATLLPCAPVEQPQTLVCDLHHTNDRLLLAPRGLSPDLLIICLAQPSVQAAHQSVMRCAQPPAFKTTRATRRSRAR
jgi:hypothetical protein